MTKTRSSNSTTFADLDSAATKDIYDEFRPRPGIRYRLSQTEANLIAHQTRINVKHTTVEYDPGQDFSIPAAPPEPRKRYVKREYKGPVWLFNEEKEEQKALETQEILRRVRQRKSRRLFKQKKRMNQEVHRAIITSMGPEWYHELSTLQMKAADGLKCAMIKDHIVGTLQNTIDSLIQLGLVLLPNSTKVQHAFKKCYAYPVQFLLLLFKYTRPKDCKTGNCYSLNDRIILSAVAHLSMRETLRELHLRTPSPPRPKIKCLRTRTKNRKSSQKITSMSPYLKPTIFKPQYQEKWIFKRRQYPELEYFDYVGDMYEVNYQAIKQTPFGAVKSTSKYNKPPKIAVRFNDKTGKLKKRIVTLKRPSSYTCPCVPAKPPPVVETEPTTISTETVEEIESDHFCQCGPSDYTRKAEFELCIEVTTSNEVINLTQKLTPFDPQNPVGELELKGAVKINEDGDESTTEAKFKNVEYSCECCICKRPLNLYDNNNKISDQIIRCHSLSQSLSMMKQFGEENGEMFGEGEGEGEEEGEGEAIYACKCKSVESVKTDIFADLDDDYHACSCKPKACSCCICEKPDPEFLLKLQRYNAVNKTNYKPCLCACRCKKDKKGDCCNKKNEKEEPGCKYCFCTKKPPGNIYVELEKDLINDELKEKSKRKSIKKKKELGFKMKPQIKRIKPKNLEDIIYEEENFLNSIPDDMEEMEMEGKPEQCICANLFTKYMDSHNSCVDMYKKYKEKMKLYVDEYLKSIEDTCYCGDSIHKFSPEGEGEGEEDLEKKKEDDCGCIQAVQDKMKKKKKGEKIEGCNCGGDNSSEDSSMNYCCCSHPQIVEVLQEETTFVKSEKEDEEQPTEDAIIGSETNDPKTRTAPILSTNTNKISTKEKEIILEDETLEADPKIFVLDKFPTEKKQQMELLKQVLAALAEDNYPLAQLPECYKLPHFQVWLDKRARHYISWKQRDEYYKLSRQQWNFIQLASPSEEIPDTGFTDRALHHITFAGVNKYHAKLNVRKADYRRRLRRGHIKSGQEFFPSCFHYPLPTKTFRDVFFAYLPSDENHCHAIKPWQPHEIKDVKKRVSCLC